MRKRDPNRIEMGRRFREARERLNWSREVLAERADLSVSFIADLELGNTGTRLENFIRLCRLLDLNGVVAPPVCWAGMIDGKRDTPLKACR